MDGPAMDELELGRLEVDARVSEGFVVRTMGNSFSNGRAGVFDPVLLDPLLLDPLSTRAFAGVEDGVTIRVGTRRVGTLRAMEGVASVDGLSE